MNEQERTRINNANHELAKGLEPRKVFEFFADICAIPRGSGNMGKFGDFLVAFAERQGLASQRDATGNVIIRKPAQYMSSSHGVILQAHQDMVCVKNAEAEHDFSIDPIELLQKSGWLHAKGTTMGADDGIGVALALGILADQEIPHPPLEALFTVDEETDMKGAKAIRAEDLRGDTLINLDAEDLNIAYVSSAAGVALALELPLEREREPRAGWVCKKILLDGLLGGHSGIEINRARANAYVLLARFINAASKKEPGISVHFFGQNGAHGADNAIPDRACARVSIAPDATAGLTALAQHWEAVFRNEYRSSDPNIRLRVEDDDTDTPLLPMTMASSDKLLRTVQLLMLGAFRFIQTGDLMKIPYGELLVETSCNLGIVSMEENIASLTLLARGSTQSVLDDLVERIAMLATTSGGRLRVTNRTSGWEMPKAPTPVQLLFQSQGLECKGVHAGLECGCLIEIFEKSGRNLDAISIGPDLKDVHSHQERLHIGSVGELWRQLLAVLAALK